MRDTAVRIGTAYFLANRRDGYTPCTCYGGRSTRRAGHFGSKITYKYRIPNTDNRNDLGSSFADVMMPPSYRRLQQYAIAISIISILYNGAEGVVSVGLGSTSSSRSLVFFGVQSGIEVISAGIVVWRFNKVARPGEEKGVSLGARELRYVTH